MIKDRAIVVSTKKWCRQAAAFAGALAILTCPMASAGTTLRYTSHVPPAHYATKLILEPFFARIAEATDGQVTINFFPGGQLAGADGTLNAVKYGIADMGSLQMGSVAHAFPLSSIAEVPGAFSDYETGALAFAQLVREDLTETEFLPNGIRPVSVALLPQSRLILATEQNRFVELSDLAGLKIRVPHAGGAETVSALGMVAVRMPITDVYTALQRGTIDGVMTPPASALAYNLDEVATSVVANLAFDPIAVAFVISEKSFQKLSPEQQQRMIEVGIETDKTTIGKLSRANSEAEQKLAEAGMTFVEISDAGLTDAKAVLMNVRTRWIKAVAARDPRAFAIADRFQALQAQ